MTCRKMPSSDGVICLSPGACARRGVCPRVVRSYCVVSFQGKLARTYRHKLIHITPDPRGPPPSNTITHATHAFSTSGLSTADKRWSGHHGGYRHQRRHVGCLSAPHTPITGRHWWWRRRHRYACRCVGCHRYQEPITASSNLSRNRRRTRRTTRSGRVPCPRPRRPSARRHGNAAPGTLAGAPAAAPAPTAGATADGHPASDLGATRRALRRSAREHGARRELFHVPLPIARELSHRRCDVRAAQ